MSITIWNASPPVDNVTPPDKSPESLRRHPMRGSPLTIHLNKYHAP
jgi:hypothetical protein